MMIKKVTEKYIEKTLNDLVQKLMIPDNGQYLAWPMTFN